MNFSYHRSKPSFTLLAIYLLLTVPGTAFAYLDPGTGNVLIYVCISLVGALLYALKSGFYALMRLVNKKAPVPGAAGTRSAVQSASAHERLALFSEGRSYWHTFKPIVDSLIVKGCPFSYYSMDVDDPGLTIENDLMDSHLIGKGAWGMSKMGRLRADIMVATTPNIGTPGYPMKRSPNVKSMVHVFHGVDDIALYHRGSLDHYDVALMVGDFLADSIRRIEKIRGLKPKTLISAGLPYFDMLAEEMPNPLPPTDGNTVLVAPSWGTKGCLSVYGTDFIRQLVEAGFNVILRPHPQSYKVEQKMISDAHKALDHLPRFTWDKELDGSVAMAKADLMISDTSVIRMDYALLYERPVITLETPVVDPEQWEIADLGSAWMDTMAYRIGTVIKKNEIGTLADETRKVLAQTSRNSLAGLRSECVANFRHSGEFIADYLITELHKMDTASQEAVK